MKVKLSELRKMIKEERVKILQEMHPEEPISELRQFSESRGGRRVVSAANKVTTAAETISEVALDHTGRMRETLYRVSEFVGKVGESLTSLGGGVVLGEGEVDEVHSPTSRLPSVQELRRLHKIIEKLEK